MEQETDVNHLHCAVGTIAPFFSLLHYTLEENSVDVYLEAHPPNSLISNSHAYLENGESGMSFCGTLFDTVRISLICDGRNQTVLSRKQKGLSSCAHLLQI